MVAVIQTMKSLGASPPIPLSQYPSQWRTPVGLLLNFSGGGPAVGTATVQISNDPLALTSPTTVAWNAHDLMQGLTADTNSSLIVCVVAVRLLVTAYTSGVITLQVCQTDRVYGG